MRSAYFKKDTIVENELQEMKQIVHDYQKGDLENEVFKPRRLMQGVYGQRQSGVQMLRIKLPAGNLNAEQTKCIAEIANAHSHGILHITTRQDIQLHFIPLEDIPPVLEKLATVGLTTREACGNSVRNVSTSPFSGSLINEVFDVVPAAIATSQFFLRNKDTQALPRKFKIGFSESKEDIAVTGMHDLGAIAKMANGKPGFKVVVGGGLGSQPFPAVVYSEFVSPDELLLHFLAIARVFNKYGERQKRMKARIKFLVHKVMGIEKFIEACKEEIQLIQKENIHIPTVLVNIEETEHFEYKNPFSEATEKNKSTWFDKNVMPTKRKNEWMVVVHSPLGDLTVDQTYKIIELLKNLQKDYQGEEFITVTDNQNFVLKGIVSGPGELYEKFNGIYNALEELKLNNYGYYDISDPVACPGTSSCNLGITHSKGLASSIRDVFGNTLTYDKNFDGTTIHISGCPNSCGRHHIGTFGFFGRSDKISEEEQAPAYNVMLGGINKGDGEIVIAKRCQKILAKRVPSFIQKVMDIYQEEKQGNEKFTEFCSRLEKGQINEIIETFNKEKMPIQKNERINYDWGEDVPYVVEFGEGECGV